MVILGQRGGVKQVCANDQCPGRENGCDGRLKPECFGRSPRQKGSGDEDWAKKLLRVRS